MERTYRQLFGGAVVRVVWLLGQEPDRGPLFSDACPKGSIAALMWIPSKLRPPMLCPNLSFSLLLWDRCRIGKNLCSPHTPLSPLFINPEFIPGLASDLFQWWENKGLPRIMDFLSGNKLYSLEYYQSVLQLPSSELP